MNRLVRSGAGAVRQALRLRGEERFPGGWWTPGTHEPTGHLFGEEPLAPGESRKWEDWEAPFYLTGIATVMILSVGLSARPDTGIQHWARDEAKRRMEEGEE